MAYCTYYTIITLHALLQPLQDTSAIEPNLEKNKGPKKWSQDDMCCPMDGIITTA